MRMKRWIPAFCLALGLSLAVPVFAGATGVTGDVTQETETEPPLESGWQNDETGHYYIGEDGNKLTKGFYTIENKLYYFDLNGYINLNNPGPKSIGTSLYFFNEDGSLAGVGLYTFQGNTYCIKNSYGLIAMNEVASCNGKFYACDKKGRVMTSKTGIVTINGKKYYVKKGVVQVNKTKRTIDNKVYYLRSDGSVAHYLLIKNNKFYYRSDAGKARTGWFKDAATGKKYYAGKNGKLKTGWQKYNGKRYYFNPKTGSMKFGWLKLNGKSYYLNPKNGVLKTGWFTVNKNKYYGSKSSSPIGARLKGFQNISGKRYYFDKKGVMQKGWVTVSGKKYYFSKKGVMSTGWKKISGKSYYFEVNGVMKTGWMVYKGSYYYLDPKTGAAATGTRTIDGVTYKFSKSGVSNREIPGSYSIRVNRQQNVVTIYKGGIPIKAILCSTGLNNATPAGSFRLLTKLYWHELNGPTFGYYCSHITSDILFHSIPAPTLDRSKVPSYKYNALGNQASQGCIRLAMGDAYWIYKNCPIGTPVTVYDSSNPGPLGKPVLVPMSTNPVYGYDPTDPNR